MSKKRDGAQCDLLTRVQWMDGAASAKYGLRSSALLALHRGSGYDSDYAIDVAKRPWIHRAGIIVGIVQPLAH